MKAEFQIESAQMVADITREVVKAIKPLLVVGKAEDDTLYTVQTLAVRLGVSPQWVYERVQMKEIPHIKIGKFPRFKKSEINKWLDDQRVPVARPMSKRLILLK